MIRALRRKFIVTAMLSVFAVLVLIMGSIILVNYNNVIQNSESRMDFLAKEGKLNAGGDPGTAGNDKQAPAAETEGDASLGDAAPGGDLSPEEASPGDYKDKPEKDGLGYGKHGLGPEAHYDSRYFTVQFNAAGKVTEINTGKIAAVDTDGAEEMALRLYEKNKTAGFLDSFRYRAKENGDGVVYTFLDCSRELSTFYSFVTASVIVSTFGLLLCFLLILFFSRMALRPAQESYEKQKRFITDASHEIKTPLAVIGAAAEVIELDTGESEWTESIRHQIGRLTSLTEKLVLLSRMDEEAYRPEKREFSLSETVRETADSFAAVAADRDRKYEVNVEEGLFYTGDPDGIRQVASLLIDNAMKYSDKGGVVRVRLKKTNRNYELTVFNTVDKIEKGDHKEYFERFYRADQSRNSATGGHGIGLSVAAAIVKQHKGKITAVSADEHSIEFRVVL